VIGLELLSLACPDLCLGSDIVQSFYTCVTLSLLWLFDPISVKNRIWVTRLELVRCDADGSRLCPVRCWKPVVSYHTQI
jgi:hypothetical protein